MLTETQPFKGLETYFTDSLLHRETSRATKEPLPDEIDSGNETDFTSEED